MNVSFRCLHGRVAAVLRIIAAVAMLADVARAEFPRPQLNAIVPSGGQRGTAVEVTIVGSDLDDLGGLRFSHPGIVAKPVLAAATEFDPQPRPVAGRMRVEIAAEVRPGVYEAVAAGRYGVSNPRLFMVGAAAEISKPSGIVSPDKAAELPLPATVSGVATAGVADHYAVNLAAGQRIRFDVWARRIDSRLTPAFVVLDPAGRIVGRPRRRHGEDPYLDFVANAAGRYVVRVHDLYMGGGDDMHYRLSAEPGPSVDAVYPPVATPGGTVRLTVLGRRLPGGSPAGEEDIEQADIDVQAHAEADRATGRPAARIFAARDVAVDLVDLSGGVLDALPAPLAVLSAAGEVTLEQEPNDESAQPQKITLPAIVAGRFHPRGDRDWISFDAQAGDEWVFDLVSRRLGLPTDASLLVESSGRTADGKPVAKEVAFVDDGPAEFQGGILDRPAFDPAVRFKAPADGSYRLLVRELAADSRAGMDRGWVLEARKPAPGFKLVATLAQPDRVDAKKLFRAVPTLQRGGRFALDVLVVRVDGHVGEITLEPQGLPAGVSATPTVIPPQASRGTLVLTAAESAQPFTGSFRVLGRGPGDDREADSVARVAALVWNVDDANTPVVMRDSHDIPLAVTTDLTPITVTPREEKAWEVTANGRVEVPLDVVRRSGAKGPLSLTATGLPAELKVNEVKIDDKASAATVEITAGGKLPPGTHVVLLKGVTKMSFARNPQAAERARADADRVAAVAKERATRLEAAKQAVAAAEAKQSDPPAVAAKAAAQEALRVAEAEAKAADAERGRREEAAKAAAAAAAPKDIDVPLIVTPITIVVTAPKPTEETKP